MSYNKESTLQIYLDGSGCWWSVSDAGEIASCKLNCIPLSDFEDGAKFPSVEQWKKCLSKQNLRPRRAVVLLDHRDTGYSAVTVPTKRQNEQYHAAELAAQSIITRTGEHSAPVFDYISERTASGAELSVYTADPSVVDAVLATLSSLAIPCACISTHLHILGSNCGCNHKENASVRVFLCDGEMVSLAYHGAALNGVHRQHLNERANVRTREIEGAILQCLLSSGDDASPVGVCVSALDDSVNKEEAVHITTALRERAGIDITWQVCPKRPVSVNTALAYLPVHALRISHSKLLTGRIKPDFAHPKKLTQVPRNAAYSMGVAAVLAAVIFFYQRPQQPAQTDNPSLAKLTERQAVLESKCKSLEEFVALANLIQANDAFAPAFTKILARLADVREKAGHELTLTRSELLRRDTHTSHVRISVLSPTIEAILSYQRTLAADAEFEVYMHNWDRSTRPSGSAMVEAEIDIYVCDRPPSVIPPTHVLTAEQSLGADL